MRFRHDEVMTRSSVPQMESTSHNASLQGYYCRWKSISLHSCSVKIPVYEGLVSVGSRSRSHRNVKAFAQLIFIPFYSEPSIPERIDTCSVITAADMALRVPHRLFPAAAPKSIITPRATAVSVNQIQGLPSLHSPALRFPTTCAASPFSAASLRFCCSCSGSTQQPQTRQKLQWQSLSQLQSQARTRLESHRRTMAATSTSAPASAAASTPTVPTDVPIKYAEGEDVRQLSSEVKALVDNGWRIDEEGVGVKKAFYFKGYFKAVV